MLNNLITPGILGVGGYVPDKVLNNSDLEKMVETSDEWIVRRTGISERRILDKDTPAFEMGVYAAAAAIKDAGLEPTDIDLIITSTNSPDYLVPSTAAAIQGRIGASKAAAFDLNAACSGFVYAVTVAQQFVATGYYKHVLAMGCEGLSRVTDWEDRNTCILFGDGAGAAVIGAVDAGYGILSSYIDADGVDGEIQASLPAYFIQQKDIDKRPNKNKYVLNINGKGIMKFSIKAFSNSVRKVMDEANLTFDDVKYIIPHQANIRIMEDGAKALGISMDKVFSDIHKFGNISSACIPMALSQMEKEGLLEKGDNIVVVGFGGGLTWGAAAIKWSK